MTDDARAWKVLPHDPIEKLTENLWRVEGELPHFGMRRVMAVARLEDGRLVLHSGMALNDPSMKELEAFGTPSFLLVPHVRHRLDAPRLKARYPGLIVLAPDAVVAKASEVVKVDGTYADFPANGSVVLSLLHGVGKAEGVMVVQSKDGVTVVLNEVVFNLRKRPKVLANLALRALRIGPGPRVTPFVKLEMVKSRAQLRDDLERLAGMPALQRLIVSHEQLSSGADAARVLRRAAATL
jgi:hypothetical protein